jgi:K+-transporting ATPase KdpF subunit
MGVSDNLLGLFIALGLLVYLVYALARAERF